VMYLYLSKDHARIAAKEAAQQQELDSLTTEESGA